MSLNIRTDIENVVYLHNGVLLVKNNDFMELVDKWMELDNIILSEVSQTQKDMHGMYLLISGY